MEPLSAVASSISVLQLSASSVKHLRDVCDSEGPKVRLLLEISTTKGILETLKDLSTNASKSDPVLENIETLQEPMKRYEALLKKLEAKLSSSHGLKKVAKALKWPTEKSEIAESLVQLERYEMLFGLAMHADQLELGKAIRRDLEEDQNNVPLSWFERQKQRPVQRHDPSLRSWLATEVNALKAFHDGNMNADEAALSLTHPLSVSSIPASGGYSDDFLAVANLWLLYAIARAPDNLHKGEAVDDEGEKLTWAKFPYFGMIWHESMGADMRPGQICRQYSDSTLLALARKLYLKMKDAEAQLVANDVLTMNKAMIQLIIQALEKEIDQSDEQLAPDEATGSSQVKLDFHIPAASYMFKYNAGAVHEQVVTKGLGDWTKRQLPDGARDFQNGAETWSFWRKRLEQLSEGTADDEVKVAAQASLEYMSRTL
ncbi:unnamed protein product [Zymoseptoria tritici ST99CH_1A5]|uniref:Uncharacterized protein n=1 Tax=Zymoseptoria tritici ST99CH_1A5 TaxID=1276529 RepID=A0A1Y6LL66_ZYMTR|nr:unnamed protein product [Zymoseptoria tritici ST99CH_1A5]